MQGLIAQQGMPIKFAEVGFIVQNRVKQTASSISCLLINLLATLYKNPG